MARWPDRYSGERIRVEHWVVAERMGQVAALNIMGLSVRFDAVPFFWSRHYHDLNIDYLGHALDWDDIAVEGKLEAKRALLKYRRGGRVLRASPRVRRIGPHRRDRKPCRCLRSRRCAVQPNRSQESAVPVSACAHAGRFALRPLAHCPLAAAQLDLPSLSRPFQVQGSPPSG